MVLKLCGFVNNLLDGDDEGIIGSYDNADVVVDVGKFEVCRLDRNKKDDDESIYWLNKSSRTGKDAATACP